MMEAKKAIEYIVNWLNGYCEQSKMNGFVVGISGGIDSAVTSALCAQTGKKVMCITMPILQHKAEYDRAHEHIEWLKKKYPNVVGEEVDLTNSFKTLEATFPKDIQDWLTMANVRSRLRMLTLYAFAGNQKLLVAGTGNKIEDFGVGFFTKYGDGGVDLSPIADLMKSEVYLLAKEMGIVASIQTAAPTDGLWADGRTDEDQIGASYDELEWAMLFINHPHDFYILTERQKKVLDIYTKLNNANQHKMNPIPVCTIPLELRK